MLNLREYIVSLLPIEYMFVIYEVGAEYVPCQF